MGLEALGWALREGFALVIACLLPLLATAAGVGLLVAWLTGSLGLRDAAIGQIARALAVVAALGFLLEGMAAAGTDFAVRCWSLHDAGSDP